MKKQKSIILLCWLFALGMLYVDIQTPRGYDEWMLYMVPSAILGYFAPRLAGCISTLGFTVFLAIGWVLSPPGTLPPGIGILNRFLASLLVWTLFLLMAFLKKRNNDFAAVLLAAEKNAERIQLLFDSAAIGLVEVEHPELRIKMANKRFLEILGYSGEELCGRSIIELTFPEDRQKTHYLNTKLIEGEITVLDYEKRFLRKDGSAVWMHVTARPIFDRKNKFQSSIGTLEDISVRKQAEDALRQSEERYRNLFESMDEGFAMCEMIFDKNGEPADFCYLEVNPAFTRLSGLTADKVIGRKVSEAIGGIEPFWIETYGRIVRTGKSERVINRVMALGRYFEVFAWKIDDRRFAVVFGDVTSRVLMEDELHRRAEDLQLAVAELEGFSYSIAHDLRSPLRAVVSYAQMIRQEAGDKLNDRWQDYLDRICNAGRTIYKKTEELLEFSRIRAAAFKLSIIDLSAQAWEIAEKLTSAAPSRTVEWRIQNGIKATGDPALIQCVLRQLLDNAWKFTAKKESAIIVFGSTMISGENVYFVKDNGAGFNMAFSARLFKPFSRLHTVEQFAGSGMGLAIVKRIIERHHGRIWAEAMEDSGATFYFTLPGAGETAFTVG